MSFIRVNLHRSFDAFKHDHIITCPVNTHAGYYDLMEAKPGDLVVAAVPTSMVGAIAVVESTHIGNLDYCTLGGRLTLDKRITVKVRVLAMFDNLSQEEFIAATGVSLDAFKCPFFSYRVTQYDKAKFRDILNSQIIQDLED